MFEFHGWATIRFTAENRDRDDEDELQNAAVEKVWSYVQQLGYDSVDKQAPNLRNGSRPHSRYSGKVVSAAKANVVLELQVMNGQAQLWVAGCKNHSAPVGQELQELFNYIARVAPGSYGLLYTLDDEDPVHVRVHVLARGAFTARQDPFLSPFVPVVEDSYSDS